MPCRVPSDVLVMQKDDAEEDTWGATEQDAQKAVDSNDRPRLGKQPRTMIAEITARNAQHLSNYLIVSRHGKRMTATMLRMRWDDARNKAKLAAIEIGDELLATMIG